MKYFALFLAVNAPNGSRNPLHYAEADARRMRRFFTGALGRIPRECTEEILGRNATRASVLRYLAALARLPIENLLIYWCGHGSNAGIQLYDGMLTYAELRQLLGGIGARAKVLFMNTCRAGAARHVIGGRAAFGGIDESMETLLALCCPGGRLLAAVSDTESAHEDHGIGGSRFTCGLLHTLTRAQGDLVADGVSVISDNLAMAGTTDFLMRHWPNEPLPELYGPIGDCFPFPLAVSQAWHPVGYATIERCEAVSGPGMRVGFAVYDRQHLATFVRWHVTDAFGRVVGEGLDSVEPESGASRFDQRLHCDMTRHDGDPFLTGAVARGRGVELTWNVEIEDVHGRVLAATALRAPYWCTQVPSVHFGM